MSVVMRVSFQPHLVGLGRVRVSYAHMRPVVDSRGGLALGLGLALRLALALGLALALALGLGLLRTHPSGR